MATEPQRYTLLLIEPDLTMAERIIGLIAKQFPSIHVIGVADTATSALTLAQSAQPDFIVTELVGLGMTGRDFLEQLQALVRDSSWLIVSALDYPELIAAAFRGGALDYLLKPVSDTALLAALDRAVTVRAEQRRFRLLEGSYRAYRLMAKPLLERFLLEQVCQPLDVVPERALPPLRELLLLLDREGLVAQPELSLSCLVIIFASEEPLEPKAIGRFQEILRSLCDCIVSPITLGRMTAVLFSLPGKPAPEEVAALFQARMRTAGCEVTVRVGPQSTTLSGCRASYRVAIEQSAVPLQGDDASYQEAVRPRLAEMLRLLEAGEMAVAKGMFDRLCEEFLLRTTLPLEVSVRRLLFVVLETAQIKGIPHEQLGELLLSVASISEGSALMRCSHDAFALFARPHHQPESSLVHQVDQYLQAHYADPLTLQEVADQVSLTPYYLSRRYKQESGMLFHEKLTSVRIEQAKQLLRNQPLSIKDVATQVGYHEPAYFSKVFTRAVGVSPATYKKKMGL